MIKQEIFLGNGAIALGLVEAGCQIVTSYPGTPSSEILPEVVRLKNKEKLDTYVEWSTNEKVALDTAFNEVPIEYNDIKTTIDTISPKKFKDINCKVFEAGYERGERG